MRGSLRSKRFTAAASSIRLRNTGATPPSNGIAANAASPGAKVASRSLGDSPVAPFTPSSNTPGSIRTGDGTSGGIGSEKSRSAS